MKNQSCN